MFTKQPSVRYCTRVGAVRLYEQKERWGGGGVHGCVLYPEASKEAGWYAM
jgi:hypothetical protein